MFSSVKPRPQLILLCFRLKEKPIRWARWRRRSLARIWTARWDFPWCFTADTVWLNGFFFLAPERWMLIYFLTDPKTLISGKLQSYRLLSWRETCESVVVTLNRNQKASGTKLLSCVMGHEFLCSSFPFVHILMFPVLLWEDLVLWFCSVGLTLVFYTWFLLLTAPPRRCFSLYSPGVHLFLCQIIVVQSSLFLLVLLACSVQSVFSCTYTASAMPLVVLIKATTYRLRLLPLVVLGLGSNLLEYKPWHLDSAYSNTFIFRLWTFVVCSGAEMGSVSGLHSGGAGV